jgi:hypothetical protein
VSHGKALSLLSVLFVALGANGYAQWGPTWPEMPGSNRDSDCENVSIIVRDSTGIGIVGATVIPENAGLETTTDMDGRAAVPCSARTTISSIQVSAPGYKSRSITFSPGMDSYLEVKLDRVSPRVTGSGGTVSASELSGDIQAKSSRLQSEANAALAKEDYVEAKKLLSEALQLTPSSATLCNNLGVVALRQKNYDEAGDWFQRAVKSSPGQADILGNLGLVRWIQQRDQESYEILTRAFQLGYESKFGHYILGVGDLKKGQLKDSVAHLKKAPAERFPYRDLYLSIALRNMGKTKAAEESYHTFLQHNPARYFVAVNTERD